MLDQETLRFIFGLKVRGLRLDKGLSLKELSRATGLSPSYLNEIEKGKKYPKQEKIFALANSLGTTHEDLVSIKLKKELFLINQLVEKNILTGLPFEVFGIPANTIFELFAERPKKMGALIGTLLEIARMHDISIDDFYFATLRSYINMHQNYFPGVEEKVDRFRADFEFTLGETPQATAEALIRVLTDDFKIQVRDFSSQAFPELQLMYFVRQEPSGEKTLAIRDDLSLRERNLILAREVGFQYLRVKTRPKSSQLVQLDSFEQLFNHFSASYFASALLVEREKLNQKLSEHFQSQAFLEADWLSTFDLFHAPMESVFYRIAQVLPKFFELDQIYLLRTEQEPASEDFEIVRELHLTSLHSPHSVRRGEDYCRRWVTSKLLRNSQGPSVASQISKFHQRGQEYLNIAASYSEQDGKRVCLTIGISTTPTAKQRIRWLSNSQCHEVGSTCQRCQVVSCESRRAKYNPKLDSSRFDRIDDLIQSTQVY